MYRTIASAALLAAALGSAQAATLINNGGDAGVSAVLDDAGNFDASGPLGLRYNGIEFANVDVQPSWYRFEAGTSYVAQYGSNPFGASTFTAGPSAAASVGLGAWSFSQIVTASASNKISVAISLTNNTGATVSGAQWSVGLDADPDGSGFNTTLNTITGGPGNGAAVSALGQRSHASVTLANDTSASATAVVAFINSGNCCDAVLPSAAFAGPNALGTSTLADDTISLAYSFGDIANGQSVSIGYSYTFAQAVPEPQTEALMLAGLASLGWLAWRRRSAPSAQPDARAERDNQA